MREGGHRSTRPLLKRVIWEIYPLFPIIPSRPGLFYSSLILTRETRSSFYPPLSSPASTAIMSTPPAEEKTNIGGKPSTLFCTDLSHLLGIDQRVYSLSTSHAPCAVLGAQVTKTNETQPGLLNTLGCCSRVGDIRSHLFPVHRHL